MPYSFPPVFEPSLYSPSSIMTTYTGVSRVKSQRVAITMDLEDLRAIFHMPPAPLRRLPSRGCQLNPIVIDAEEESLPEKLEPDNQELPRDLHAGASTHAEGPQPKERRDFRVPQEVSTSNGTVNRQLNGHLQEQRAQKPLIDEAIQESVLKRKFRKFPTAQRWFGWFEMTSPEPRLAPPSPPLLSGAQLGDLFVHHVTGGTGALRQVWLHTEDGGWQQFDEAQSTPLYPGRVLIFTPQGHASWVLKSTRNKYAWRARRPT
ncbi:hypothetical protein JAAARDRAFT_72704 [Jaapia argillacea MUCL 33604]|uniref:Uncharacterized protein n=1 Tax=Jaapia argillacea MUCL 33604 TaxID=933084 RepID=A0A067PH78_9AGAM|nr:hypothetical protein JAAARDRAFT_72704 [Jaapia argillacea MUCL 33604]